jgi:hypothetical protein
MEKWFFAIISRSKRSWTEILRARVTALNFEHLTWLTYNRASDGCWEKHANTVQKHHTKVSTTHDAEEASFKVYGRVFLMGIDGHNPPPISLWNTNGDDMAQFTWKMTPKCQKSRMQCPNVSAPRAKWLIFMSNHLAKELFALVQWLLQTRCFCRKKNSMWHGILIFTNNAPITKPSWWIVKLSSSYE